jgi:predicted RNA binding protein YcfA (HicA-like mRNA interferase family)
MMLSHQHFAIPYQFKLAQILEMLQSRYDVRVEPSRTIKRIIFDTFDWSLYQKGTHIEMQQVDRKITIVWHATNPLPSVL